MSRLFNAGGWGQVREVARRLWAPDAAPPDLEADLAELRAKVPAPTFWLFGKTQSGKTSLIKYLTGAEDAAIGSGFRPTTRTSREYPFPTAEVPVLTFLDTRGVDEPGYDPAEDIAAFHDRAHLVVVTCRITDFAHGGVRTALEKIRRDHRSRPVVLALTCLHEIDPQDPHPKPYPFDPLGGVVPRPVGAVPDKLFRLVTKQAEEFAGLVDRIVPIDLTRPEEGYDDPHYGGDALKAVLLDSLPGAYRSAFARLDEVSEALKDIHLKHALPVIMGYSSLAATAGAIPVPFVDLALLPPIQGRMIHALARLYGQPLSAQRFLELAGTVGLGLVARQAAREVVKLIPVVGSAAGGALAGASTYALGRAFCEYFQRAHDGHVPSAGQLRKLYADQLGAAERIWKSGK
jgi:uncharacterized protein (DUF697 family)